MLDFLFQIYLSIRNIKADFKRTVPGEVRVFHFRKTSPDLLAVEISAILLQLTLQQLLYEPLIESQIFV
jgi:hypothetical protein